MNRVQPTYRGGSAHDARGGPTAVALATVDAVLRFLGARVGIVFPAIGQDLDLHRDAARRWLETGSPYLAAQLAGAYDVWTLRPVSILYPDNRAALRRLLALPPSVAAVLWYTIPFGVTAAAIALHRPRPNQMVVIGLPAFWPQSVSSLCAGNVVIWMMAGLAVGAHMPGSAPVVFLKPSLFRFGFWNAHRRSWWLGLAALTLVSIPFAPLGAEWIAAVLNARQSQGAFYSIYEAPMLFIPLVPVLRWPSAVRVSLPHAAFGRRARAG